MYKWTCKRFKKERRGNSSCIKEFYENVYVCMYKCDFNGKQCLCLDQFQTANMGHPTKNGCVTYLVNNEKIFPSIIL